MCTFESYCSLCVGAQGKLLYNQSCSLRPGVHLFRNRLIDIPIQNDAYFPEACLYVQILCSHDVYYIVSLQHKFIVGYKYSVLRPFH